MPTTSPSAREGHRPPETSGIAVGVKALVVGGVVLAIMQGMFVAASSGFGRVWPAADSAKIPLPPSNF